MDTSPLSDSSFLLLFLLPCGCILQEVTVAELLLPVFSSRILMESYSAIRNDRYPPFASTWMELEGIMLSEVSQSEQDKHYMFSFIWVM